MAESITLNCTDCGRSETFDVTTEMTHFRIPGFGTGPRAYIDNHEGWNSRRASDPVLCPNCE